MWTQLITVEMQLYAYDLTKNNCDETICLSSKYEKVSIFANIIHVTHILISVYGNLTDVQSV